MAIATLASREFNQGTSEAKRATRHGPVFITDRGWGTQPRAFLIKPPLESSLILNPTAYRASFS